MKTSIEIEWIKSGQPRPYADSEYEAIIRYGGGYSKKIPWRPTEIMVREHARLLVKHFADEQIRQWHEGILKELVEIEPSVWKVRIIKPYLD